MIDAMKKRLGKRWVGIHLSSQEEITPMVGQDSPNYIMKF